MLYWTPFWVPFVFAAACLVAMIDNRATLAAGRGGAFPDRDRNRRSLTVISLPLQAAVLLHGLGALRWWLVLALAVAALAAAAVVLAGPQRLAMARLQRPLLVAVLAALALVLWLGYVPNY